MACGTCSAHVASVLDIDFVIQHRFTNGRASGRCDGGACGAIFGVGKNGDGWHECDSLNGLDVFARQCFGNAAVHTLSSKGFCGLGQFFGGSLYNGRII